MYIQAPLYGVEKLLEYLGRYVFRIAISNHRIVAVEQGKVRFEYYDNREDGKLKQMTLSAEEFIGRFLMHVLPSHFVRIRHYGRAVTYHYGLHHGSCRARLQQARRLPSRCCALGLPVALPVIARLKLLDWLKNVLQSEEDPRLCPFCRKGIMLPFRDLAPMTGWRVQLLSLMRSTYSVGVFARWRPAAT